MILALQKFKDLVVYDLPNKGADIDMTMYISNIVLITTKYSGLVYWFLNWFLQSFDIICVSLNVSI